MCIGQTRANALPSRVRAVVQAVADEHGVLIADLLSDCRRRRHVIPRWAAFAQVSAMSWRDGRPSYPQVGRWFGRDHTSVLYALGKLSVKPGSRKRTARDYPPPRTEALAR